MDYENLGTMWFQQEDATLICFADLQDHFVVEDMDPTVEAETQANGGRHASVDQDECQ